MTVRTTRPAYQTAPASATATSVYTRRPMGLMKVSMKRWLVRILVVLLVLVIGLVVAVFAIDEDPPTGETGPFAELLAKRMMGAVKMDRWDATGMVRFDFGGRHQHVWDRKRRLSRVRWGDTEVLMRLDDRTGVVRVGGEVVEGAAKQEALDSAYKRFINDTFWLNPMATFYNEGVTRERVELDGNQEALLVTYGSGGVTPGDKYLFYPDGRNWAPKKWKIWVSIIPVGGLEATFERYQTLQSGAVISTFHDGPIDLELKDVAGAVDWTRMYDEDPFSELVAPADAPASRPARTLTEPVRVEQAPAEDAPAEDAPAE